MALPCRRRKLPRLTRPEGQSASRASAASYSFIAAARAARLPSGICPSGTSASICAASIRTPSTGSESSGDTLSTRLTGSARATMPSAAMRTDGSLSLSSSRAASNVPGFAFGWASVTAVARMMAGASGFFARSSNRGKASAPWVAPACRVGP